MGRPLRRLILFDDLKGLGRHDHLQTRLKALEQRTKPLHGNSATVGIENHTGTDGLQFSFNQVAIRDAAAVRYSPVPADTTGPVITITSPANGDEYPLDEAVLADYTCQDAAGVASCTGPAVDSAAIDTGTAGPHSFTVTAQDSLGNPTSLTTSYTVVYDFSGFFPPVDNLDANGDPIFNKATAGSSIPVKFSLNGYDGLEIFPSGSPASKRIECDGTATTDPIEETATPGSNGLTYDSITDQYYYVWKTLKDWKTTCRVLMVFLKDGTEHRAFFSFK